MITTPVFISFGLQLRKTDFQNDEGWPTFHFVDSTKVDNAESTKTQEITVQFRKDKVYVSTADGGGYDTELTPLDSVNAAVKYAKENFALHFPELASETPVPPSVFSASEGSDTPAERLRKIASIIEQAGIQRDCDEIRQIYKLVHSFSSNI